MQLRITFLTLLICFIMLAAHTQNTSPYWSLAGNDGTTATATSRLGTTTSIPLNLTTNNLTRLRIGADGKVGIGTTNPQQLFHVEGPTLLNLFVSTSALGPISGSGQIGYTKHLPTATGQRLGYFLFGSRGGGETNLHAAGMVGYAEGAWGANASHPAYIAFETTPVGSASRVERVRIESGGNVGIGTNSPAAKLDIQGGNWNVTNTEGDFRIGNATYRLKMGVALDGGGAGDARIRATGGTNRLMLGAGDALTIAGNGNVGIGTIDPAYPLEVKNATAFYVISGQSTYQGTSNRIGVWGRSINAPGYGYGVQGVGGNIGVYGITETGSYAATTYGVYGYAYGTAGTRVGTRGFANGGATNYGVFGTAVNGSAFNAAGYFNGQVWATSYHTISDAKFKSDIAPLKNALAKVMKLRPASYQFKADEFKGMYLPKGKQLGLIASEVKEVFPELVEQAVQPAEYDEQDKTKVISPEVKYEGVNYQGLIPLLISSVQELNQKTEEIVELKKELAELKQLVNKLAGGQSINTSVSSATLLQNVPNPVKGATTISYSVPEGSNRSQLLLTDAAGRAIKVVQLTTSGIVNLDVSGLSSGVYNYSLVVDGKTVQTRKMTVTR